MNNLSHIKNVYFLGIGGIGMSAICRYLLSHQIVVFGYDKTPTPLTDELIQLGAKITFDDRVEAIPSLVAHDLNTLVILTPAIPSQHPQKLWFENQGFHIKKRSEILGLLTQNTECLAVAGTHGKTTTSTLLAHILNSLNIEFSAFLGGISSNYNSNYVENTQGRKIFENPISVVEADEFDRSFHRLKPAAAIITAIDADHLDIYEDEHDFKNAFITFANLVNGSPAERLFINDQLNIEEFKNAIKYGENNDSDYCISDVKIEQGKYHFKLKYREEMGEFQCGLAGRHNVWNAAAAVAMLHGFLKIPLYEFLEPIKTFKGVKRRFEYLVDQKDFRVIDDYAHHPEELKNAIASVRELYPTTKITGIFQPHLFTRTRDFAEGFAEELGKLDQLWLLEIYPARELPIAGVNSTYLKSLIKSNIPVKVITKEEVLEEIKTNKPETLVILGAGDIDTLRNPIQKLYE